MITSPWCVIRLPWLVEPKFITICQIYVHVQTRRLVDEALSKPISHMFIIIRILSSTCCNFSLDVNWRASFFCMSHDVHKFCFFSRQLMCNCLFFCVYACQMAYVVQKLIKKRNIIMVHCEKNYRVGCDHVVHRGL